MKTLKQNLVEGNILNEKEMSAIQGGRCVCGCRYADNGGSSTNGNGSANSDGNLHTVNTKSAAYNAEGDYWHE